ncbi:hypothetical protein BABINDRAFT_163665 [Babjeviella inositovora NRRL Y-12698]|uniref:Uncharacterized protein n=1 Tax=Babjeviella inositovora NRRL Y-12698 TaxID=984486 RepID=A0A1E3QHG6_9ASCO|nr:uncharacterized protein BABINDRAFT_163665 [Babjeviella inositovora NRRL Y-12698]ODQ77153.1 hypothetical protein BABINDRAFT_163665 [Babjeviella inositovora NRRL Y-12698]
MQIDAGKKPRKEKEVRVWAANTYFVECVYSAILGLMHFERHNHTCIPPSKLTTSRV